MKLFCTTALLLALSAPAFASGIGGDSINGNTGIAVNGTVQGSTFNNNSGPGAGGTFAPSSSSSSRATANQGQFQAQSQAAKSSVKDSGNSTNSITVQAQKRNPVATAYAAPLVAAPDTCLGSSSAGIQAVGFGISGGSTVEGSACVRWVDSRKLADMGYADASLARFCMDNKVREAMRIGGTPCPQDESDHQESTESDTSSGYAYPTNTKSNGRPL